MIIFREAAKQSWQTQVLMAQIGSGGHAEPTPAKPGPTNEPKSPEKQRSASPKPATSPTGDESPATESCDVYQCGRGCGFVGTFAAVSRHEEACEAPLHARSPLLVNP